MGGGGGKLGGGGKWGGGQIGAKSWIFQTELGPIYPLQDVINVMLFSTR